MRISTLSTESGLPVATLKFYLREGLLPAGELTAPNQAEYDEAHLQRIRLIRVLSEVGRLPIASIRDVVAALEQPRLPLHRVVGVVHHALASPAETAQGPELDAAEDEVNEWLATMGWQISASAPSRRTLAEALLALRSLGRVVTAQDFAKYAATADKLAGWELRRAARLPVPTASALVESVVVGTVVYESVLAALRKLAQEHHFARTARELS